MSSQNNERAFESYVAQMLHENEWKSGTNAEWDVERALFPVRICAFLQETQPQRWEEMRALHAAGLEALVINALAKELDVKGTLHILRHGFKVYGKTFRLAYFKPAHGLNDEVLALYAKNQLTITRQALCHPGKHDTVDLLFAVNGLPVATCELKNPGTGQSWRHAVRQYQKDRDQRAPLFGFKTRALVHFAADPDEVHMATRLRGESTLFLPFNRGSHPGEVQCGAGNPQHPSGYRTGYFWEEVFQRESFLDILGHFMFVEKDARSRHGTKSKTATVNISLIIILNPIPPCGVTRRSPALRRLTRCARSPVSVVLGTRRSPRHACPVDRAQLDSYRRPVVAHRSSTYPSGFPMCS